MKVGKTQKLIVYTEDTFLKNKDTSGQVVRKENDTHIKTQYHSFGEGCRSSFSLIGLKEDHEHTKVKKRM